MGTVSLLSQHFRRETDYCISIFQQSFFCFPSHYTPNNICCSLKNAQSTDPIKLNDPFVHCLWIKLNAPEWLKQAVDKLVPHADIIDNIHLLKGYSPDLL